MEKATKLHKGVKQKSEMTKKLEKGLEYALSKQRAVLGKNRNGKRFQSEGTIGAFGVL